MLDKESSLRLSVIRFPLIVCVVFIHAHSSTVGFSDGVLGLSQSGFFSNLIRSIISQEIARVAVPVFFIISSYLFYIEYRSSLGFYLSRLKSRARTLLIPFLFWNFFNLVFIAFAQSVPELRKYFSGNNFIVSEFEFYDYLNAIIGVDRAPVAYQFWFIRDLIVLVFVSPLIYFFVSFLPFLFLTCLVFLWFFDVGLFFVPSPDALLFFSLGAYFGVRGKNLFCMDRFGRYLVFFYLLILLVSVFFSNSMVADYLHKIGVVFGVVVVLFFSKFIIDSERWRSILIKLGGASFFVYAVHEPILTIIRKFLYRIIVPESSLMVLVLYFVIPVMTILLSVFFYRVLYRTAPGFVAMVTGGR